MENEKIEIQDEIKEVLTDEPVKEEVSQEEEKATQEDERSRNKISSRNRIGQLTKNWREEQRENERLRSELDAAKQVKRVNKQPNQDDYDSNDDYVNDQEQWNKQKEQEIESRITKKLKQEQRERELMHQQAKIAEGWVKTKNKAVKQYDNFVESEQEVIATIRDYNAVDMQDAILESENRAAIVDHLGNKPELLDEIAQMPPRAQDRAIARLDIKLGNKPVKKESAPEPIKPLVGGGANIKKAVVDMNPVEYRKWARDRGMH